jgi:hypothetical protein
MLRHPAVVLCRSIAAWMTAINGRLTLLLLLIREEEFHERCNFEDDENEDEQADEAPAPYHLVHHSGAHHLVRGSNLSDYLGETADILKSVAEAILHALRSAPAVLH